ncbi:MAG TPA: hypothetical protein VF556_06610 [Pyrinomonadaceae bacterium]|jgi:hypothetical protein
MGNWCFVFNRKLVDESTLSEGEKSDRFNDIDDTQHNLCRGLPTHRHTDGNHYCILHLPKNDKDVAEFSKVMGIFLFMRFTELQVSMAKVGNGHLFGFF